MNAADVHSALAGRWREVLISAGIDAAMLRDKHGPCPACGGTDRFRFDDRKGRGDYFCNGCGPGDGLSLLMKVRGFSFREALAEAARAAQLDLPRPVCRVPAPPPAAQQIATPTRRVLDILKTACDPLDLPDVRAYLDSRKLWPLPAGCTLRGHAGIEYFDDGKRIGKYPALVAEIRDVEGELVTLHTTFLHKNRKLAEHEPRKILSPMAGRTGCAVRLMPHAGTLGIGEGLETVLAAQRLHGVPTWSALNKTLLAKFTPPETVKKLVIFADRDAPGLEAAARLIERLQGRVLVELQLPTAPCKDFADMLEGASKC